MEESTDTYRVIYLLVIGVPLVATTVLGNLLVILAWITDARVRTPSNAYLVSLAVVDFLIGTIDMTLGLKYKYEGRWTLGTGPCQFFLVFAHTTVFVSSVHLVLIALDRHRIVCEGVSYVHNRRYTQVFQCILATWAVGLWINLPLLLDWPHVAIDPEVSSHCLKKPTFLATFYWTSTGIIFPGLLLIWLYLRIFLQLKRRQKMRVINKVIVTDSSSAISERKISDLSKIDVTVTQKRQNKAFLTLGILIGFYFMCWTPYVLISLVRSYGVVVPRILPMALGMLGWVNSAVNPVVYAVMNVKFREAFTRILSPFHTYSFHSNE